MNWLLILLFVPAIAFAAPKAKLTATPTPPPKGPVEKAGMVCRSKQQDLELRDWIGGLINQVHQAQASNTLTQGANSKLQGELAQSKLAATALANECAADKKCAQSPFSCGFRRLLKHIFWILGGVVVLCVGLSVLGIAVPWLKPILNFFLGIFSWIVRKLTPKPKPPTPTV